MAPAEFLDSAACGERKRSREIRVDPCMCGCSALEKGSRQVSEFKDTHRKIEYFLRIRPADICLEYHYDSDDEEDEKITRPPFPREAFLKYLKQVRTTYGFDVDVDLPLWLEHLRAFIPIDISEEDSYSRDIAYKAAKFAIDEINDDMNSESYELVEVVKYVLATGCWLRLLTLTAKKVDGPLVTIQALVRQDFDKRFELEQWRFKPEAHDA